MGSCKWVTSMQTIPTTLLIQGHRVGPCALGNLVNPFKPKRVPFFIPRILLGLV